MKTLKFFPVRWTYILLLFFLVFHPLLTLSQELEGDSIAFKRAQWFYYQRAYPGDSIPHYAFIRAVQQEQNLITQGYCLSGTNVWNSLGPKPLNGISGIVSGRVTTIKYDPKDQTGQKIYLGGDGGGVWKTEDAGLHWTALTDNLSSLIVGAIAVDDLLDLVYYATGYADDWATAPFYGIGIYKSTNGGLTWVGPFSNGLPPLTRVQRIVIRPNHHNEVFITTWTGLYKSTDYGETWVHKVPSQILPDTGNLKCDDIVFTPDGNTAYITGPKPDNGGPQYWRWHGVGYRMSTDGGETFTIMNNTGLEFQDRTFIAISKSSPNIIYTVSASDPMHYNVDKSTNGGFNFFHATTICDYGGQPKFDLYIYVSPYDPNIVYTGGAGFYYSYDGANTFSCASGYNLSSCNNCSSIFHADQHGFDFSPNPSTRDEIIIGNDGGVWKSPNKGQTWYDMNQTLQLAQFFRVASSPFDPEVVVGGLEDEDFAKKVTGSLTWNDCFLGYDGASVLYSPFKPNVVIGNLAAQSSSYNVYYSINSGSSFTYTSGIYGFWGGGDWCAAFAADPNIPGVFYHARRNGPNNGDPVNIFKSTDDGANYSLYHQFLPSNSYDASPQRITISNSDPSIWFIPTYFWVLDQNGNFIEYNDLFKSTDYGQTFNRILDLHSKIPDRYISQVTIDPVNENEIYLTLSGFDDNTPLLSGHVFKSQDGGYNWTNISGNPTTTGLPNIPVNDMIIYYTGCSTKKLVVATDVGVYCSDGSGNWNVLASGLPNSPCLGLNYVPLLGKIRAATLGRGAWEVNLDGPIYVPDNLFITSDLTINKQIVVCNGGKLILGHSALQDFTINFATPSNVPGIIVQNGGQIIANSVHRTALTSQSGQWGGITIQWGGYGDLQHCDFQNSVSPLTIDYSQSGGIPPPVSISVSDCHFTDGTFHVLDDQVVPVYVSGCPFSGADPFFNTAVLIENSDKVYFLNNTINSPNGISVSGSSCEIGKNTINYSTGINAFGISMDNCYSPSVHDNSISGFNCGIFTLNSSPVMLKNTVYSELTSDTALFVGYSSYPRLNPTSGENTIIWDAGINTLTASTNNGGDCLVIDHGYPLTDNGYNHFNAGNYYFTGFIESSMPQYYARYNCWNGGTYVDPAKINVNITFIGDPADCNPPPGASILEENKLYQAGGENKPFLLLDPPLPYIINLGHGFYDTIRVTNGSLNLTPDRQLLSQANKDVIEGNYSNAANTYRQIIQSYQDSISAINALYGIMHCADKMVSDTGTYSQLRSYYQNLVQSNGTDTAFVKAAKELSIKALSRKRLFPSAIIEYENVISQSADSLEILCSELNIIETYILIPPTGGNTASFVGKLAYLKPQNYKDAIRMILEKLHHLKAKQNTAQLPKEFKLSQNYPNPFNPTTKIEYALPQNTHVTIKVYDILGRLVKTLVNENQQAGYYNIIFDGSIYASGVYFYRIEAGKFVNTKKMVLVK